jgi:thioredoxin-related protein
MKKLVIAMVLMGNPVMYSQWKSDLNDALRQAQMQNKNVLLYFSVPDACAVCESLEKNVLQSQEFNTYARQNYILAKPDFHESVSMETKTDNLLIVEKYNKDGFFPLVVILDKDANVLGKTGIYNNETPQEYIKLLQSIAKK